MEFIWLPATLLAGFLQAWRTAIQQRLRADLTINGAGLVRYAYGAPLVLALLALTLAVTGDGVPPIGARFLAFAAMGAVAQLMATNLLISKSFAWAG